LGLIISERVSDTVIDLSVLIGFHGKHGSDIDSLGLIISERVSDTVIDHVIYDVSPEGIPTVQTTEITRICNQGQSSMTHSFAYNEIKGKTETVTFAYEIGANVGFKSSTQTGGFEASLTFKFTYSKQTSAKTETSQTRTSVFAIQAGQDLYAVVNLSHRPASVAWSGVVVYKFTTGDSLSFGISGRIRVDDAGETTVSTFSSPPSGAEELNCASKVSLTNGDRVVKAASLDDDSDFDIDLGSTLLDQWETGDDQSGDDQSGDNQWDQSGDDQSGDNQWDQSGDDQSGDDQSGDNQWDQSGDDQSGDDQSGDNQWDQSGDDQSGDNQWDQSGDDQSGDNQWDQSGDDQSGDNQWDQSGDDQSGDNQWDQSGDDQSGDNQWDQSGDDQSGDDQWDQAGDDQWDQSGDDQSGDDQSGDDQWDQSGDDQSGDDQSGDNQWDQSGDDQSGDDQWEDDESSVDQLVGDKTESDSIQNVQEANAKDGSQQETYLPTWGISMISFVCGVVLSLSVVFVIIFVVKRQHQHNPTLEEGLVS